MKNLKLLLLSLVGITALTSTTHALELMTSKSDGQVFGEKNGYHLRVSYNKLYCLSSSDSPSDNPSYIKLEAPICDSGNTKYIGKYSYIHQYFTLPTFGGRDYSASTYYINQDSKKLYTIHRIDKEGGGYQYIRTNLNEGSIYKIQSKRGSNIYLSAFLHGPGLTFIKKQDQGVRMATYVSQIYVLDGFAIFADTRKLLLVDTYKSKVYDYGIIRQEADVQQDNKTLFTKLYNLTPEKVYDIKRGIGQGKFTYSFEGNGSVIFDLTNEQTATDETHTTIQQDLKDSLTWLNEYSHLWLGTTPEELGITNGQPNTPNQGNNSGNSNQSYEQSLAEYNQCVGYWQNVKTYATYDRGCYRGLLDSAPLTGSYDTQALLSDRKKIKERNGSGELELGDEVACLRFAERKKSYKQKYAQKWENFQKDADDFWLNPERLVINDVCGTFLKIPPKNEGSSTQGFNLFNNFLSYRDQFNGGSGVPLISGSNIYNYDYRTDTEELKRLREMCHDGDPLGQLLLDETHINANKQEYCERYKKKKKEIIEKYQNGTGFFNSLSLSGYLDKIDKGLYEDVSLGKQFLGSIMNPFYSGMNSVDFVKPICSNTVNTNGFFDIFLYLVFGYLIFYVVKILR